MKKIPFLWLNLSQTYKMIRNNKFSIIVALIILYLSLTGAQTFDKVSFFDIPYLDKLVHLGLYFLLMAVILYEHKTLYSNTRQLIIAALIPLAFGIIIEFMQSGLTLTRKGDLMDALFDFVGITFALFLWMIIIPYYKK